MQRNETVNSNDDLDAIFAVASAEKNPPSASSVRITDALAHANPSI
jgi:hypothetical protein